MIIRRRLIQRCLPRDGKVTYRFGRSVSAWSCLSHRSWLWGFFAAAETAFLSMDKWAVEGLKDEDRRAKVLSDLEKDFRNTTSALLIGTNVFTVLSSVMAASFGGYPGVQ
ncbi:MAG: DUF21 domain-containing protein [Bacillota bacterium]